MGEENEERRRTGTKGFTVYGRGWGWWDGDVRGMRETRVSILFVRALKVVLNMVNYLAHACFCTHAPASKPFRSFFLGACSVTCVFALTVSPPHIHTPTSMLLPQHREMFLAKEEELNAQGVMRDATNRTRVEATFRRFFAQIVHTGELRKQVWRGGKGEVLWV